MFSLYFFSWFLSQVIPKLKKWSNNNIANGALYDIMVYDGYQPPPKLNSGHAPVLTIQRCKVFGDGTMEDLSELCDK